MRTCSPSPRRLPLLALPTLLLGIGGALLLTVFSLLAGGILLLGSVLWIVLRQGRLMLSTSPAARPAASPPTGQGRVLEGKYVVLRQR